MIVFVIFTLMADPPAALSLLFCAVLYCPAMDLRFVWYASGTAADHGISPSLLMASWNCWMMIGLDVMSLLLRK